MSAAVQEADEEMSGINIAPLVDVCLVLLLIFMVTSSYF
ncbi:MAG: biopolymer transporter ExbD, partial [Elusimicrobia bacterium]|nr:biopolymer transporter ExbD [Elusimicrobiota bacterium]